MYVKCKFNSLAMYQNNRILNDGDQRFADLAFLSNSLESLYEALYT